ncbi:MAG: glucose-1-phosphate cytidylyltransferase [Bacteroidota bacterium]
MKTIIFAGGLGSRISEESHLKPKPMIEIGGKPILWHIMKIYMAQGFNEFIICLGYKGYIIKEYFNNYFLHNSNITLDISNNNLEIHNSEVEDFSVTLVETGLHTKTAGRLRKVREYVREEDFMLTYGDGLADVDLKALVDFHRRSRCLATVTSIQPSGKFGVIESNEDGLVTEFIEKPKSNSTWINGGFFVMNCGVFNHFPEEADDIMLEEEPMRNLVENNKLATYRHYGFWKCMDILRDKVELEKLWETKAPWRIW